MPAACGSAGRGMALPRVAGIAARIMARARPRASHVGAAGAAARVTAPGGRARIPGGQAPGPALVAACPSCWSCFCLFAAVFLDLLEFGLGELAWHVVAGDLGTLHVVPYVLDDLGVGQGGDVPDVGEVGDRRDYPA